MMRHIPRKKKWKFNFWHIKRMSRVKTIKKKKKRIIKNEIAVTCNPCIYTCIFKSNDRYLTRRIPSCNN